MIPAIPDIVYVAKPTAQGLTRIGRACRANVGFSDSELGGVVGVGSATDGMGTVAGFGSLQPREGHRSDDPQRIFLLAGF